MTTVKPRITAIGNNFPARTISNSDKIKGLIVERINNPLEIGTFGRYRDKPIPYGSITLLLSNKAVNWNIVEKFALRLPAIMEALIGGGANEIMLHLDVMHDGQCNFDIPRSLIDAIANHPVSLTISCWNENI